MPGLPKILPVISVGELTLCVILGNILAAGSLFFVRLLSQDCYTKLLRSFTSLFVLNTVYIYKNCITLWSQISLT